MADLWDRQPDETDKAYRAFALYRDLGPEERSITKASQEYHAQHGLKGSLGTARVTVGKWSRTHGWVERVRAWDADQDRQQRAEKAAERARDLQQARERYVQISRLGWSKLVASLQSLEAVPPGVMAGLMRELRALELAGLGEATEHVKVEEVIGDDSDAVERVLRDPDKYRKLLDLTEEIAGDG